MLIVHHPKMLNFIRSDYEAEDIRQLIEFLKAQQTFDFPTLDNGLFPAALLNPETEYIGYRNVWVRDNILIAYSHYVCNQTNVSLKTVNAVMAYFQQHTGRFTGIIEAKADPNNVMERPHIRFDGHTFGEIAQTWSHAQNDALGYFLWFYCKLTTEELIKPQPEDLKMLAIFPLYFEAIRYWEDEDSGHWEETRKVEASSIGVVVAGLKRLKQILTAPSLASGCQYNDRWNGKRGVTPQFIDKLIAKGMTSLTRILPAECSQPPPKTRRYDAALLFLIYPLQIVEDAMADQILTDVITHLQGDYGVKRYLGDSFWAADYTKKLAPETRTADFSEDISVRDALLKAGEEAQWCIFDPIISVIYGLKFQKTRRQEFLNLQILYLNRSLGQLTDRDCPFGEFKCPELYYIQEGRYTPNEATPLLWTQANLQVALKIMEQSLMD